MSKEDFVAYALKRQEIRKKNKEIRVKEAISLTIENVIKIKEYTIDSRNMGSGK